MIRHRVAACVQFAVLAVLLAIAGTDLTQVVAGPSTRWKAQFENPDGATLGPAADPDTVFVGGVDGVSITNGTASCGSGPTRTYYSYIDMNVARPNQLKFSMDNFDEQSDPNASSYVVPGFPGDDQGGLTWPLNLAQFLKHPQPYSEPDGVYEHVRVRLSTSACENRIDTDLMQMTTGSMLVAKVRVDLWSHQWVCPADGNTDYNVFMNAHGYLKGLEPDIYVKRVSASQWRLHVDTLFDNPAYKRTAYPLLGDWIVGSYGVCTKTTEKGGRSAWSQQFVNPYTTARLAFGLTFTKY